VLGEAFVSREWSKDNNDDDDNNNNGYCVFIDDDNDHVGGVRLRLRSAATNGPIIHLQENRCGVMWTRENS
jgi:hypothetical protein